MDSTKDIISLNKLYKTERIRNKVRDILFEDF